LNQNLLQKGFTENSSPLLCELLVEGFERENKDLKRTTYIAMLDAKSAFDVVVHANLIRRLLVGRAELVSDRVIPIWVALSTTGIILLSIFQKPLFVSIVLILDLTGRITL
jgi:CHASE2 domain-containing sensor protein